ncbi:hypothetical protein GJV85_01825 [Sulfurimonas aquatica]|uniref:Prokaryotic metallothionein n=1 Tax=Sulfurimonas aquatica TaxID=2672570 RepID=A0A975AYF7_9BACT|nr:PP0621 family protein [Sulfurimonas aquatica]QSZ40902.1 hypothetical protein GJV85_01825 [Sulfurimonas aquatica]
MILKVLLVMAVIAIVYFMFIKKKPITDTKKKNKDKETLKTNDMIECAECGVYTEVSECMLSNGKYYCSKECLSEVN